MKIFEWVVFAAVAGWVLYRWLKKTEDPPRLIAKWAISALIIGITWWMAGRSVARSGGGLDYGTAFVVAISCAVCGIVLALTWGGDIATHLGKPITGLFDGGDLEVVPQPFYSIAEARRKQGKYREAIGEICKQLERFPGDFTGLLMLAEIQADELKDLPAAQATIDRLLAESQPSAINQALALNRLADWQLKWGHDSEAARAALERVRELFPDTEQAYMAGQRLAHLASQQTLDEQSHPHAIPLRPFQQNVGLLLETPPVAPPPEDPAVAAARLVRHLEQFPQDSESREKLAIIYASHYRRMDLAADQVEQLVSQPNAPAKHVVHWLNLLADLHVQHAGDLAGARAALQRILDGYPDLAAAENARQRMVRLPLEMRAKKDDRVVKLGSYEQNIGLKGPPRAPHLTD
jgi:tetratricopeptide (TPR) repeat protein